MLASAPPRLAPYEQFDPSERGAPAGSATGNDGTRAETAGRAGAGLELSTIASMLDQARLPLLFLDTSLRIQEANHVLLQSCGVANAATAIGRKLGDLFTTATTRETERLAAEVVATMTPLLDRRMLWAPREGAPILARVSLWPLGAGDRPEGVALTARMPEGVEPAMRRIAEAAVYIHDNIGARLGTAFLAARAGVSLSQFQRDFHAMLGSTAKRYIVSVRFEQALEMLAHGEPIASVAHACGYSDQSAFTRQFRSTMGMTPTAYMRRIGNPRLEEAARRMRIGRQKDSGRRHAETYQD